MPTLGSSNGVMLAELSGRSYEYYSEDGVLSGMLASRYSYQLSDTAVRAGRNGRPFRNPPTKRTDAPAGAGASARWG